MSYEAEIWNEGRVFVSSGIRESSRITWQAHPGFQGVSLKHLIRGEETEGALSCHLVRVDPDCALEDHIHERQGELHEVIAGTGTALVDGREIYYSAGFTALIPKGVRHSVRAGSDGLVLKAKFFPALV